MNKPNVTKFINVTKAALSKKSPEILTGLGIAGMVTTTVLAVKATPKVLMLIDAEKKRQNDELLEEAKRLNKENRTQISKLSVIDTIKVAWKPYIPALVTGTVSIACLVGASSVNARRNAALATAYQLSTTALADYKEKVVETIGEKKEQVIKDKVAQKKVEENPVSKSSIIVSDKGSTLCYDATAGRYFYSDIETIKKAINEMNRRMVLGEMYVSLNEFYMELGLPTTDIGDEVGWSVDTMIEPDFSTQITDDGRPCVVLSYMAAPCHEFRKLF